MSRVDSVIVLFFILFGVTSCGDGSLKPEEVAALSLSDAMEPRQTENKKSMIRYYLAENNIVADKESAFYDCLSHKMHTKNPDIKVGTIFGWCRQEYLVNGKFVNTYYNLDGIDSQFDTLYGAHKQLEALLKTKIRPENEYVRKKTLYRKVLSGEGAPYLVVSTWFGEETPTGYTSYFKITANTDIQTGDILKVIEVEQLQ